MSPENINEMDSSEWTLMDYWNMVLRHYWLILGVFVVVFSVVAIYSLTRPAKYESSATFIIDSTDNGIGGMFGNKNPMFAQQQRPIEFYEALMQSQAYMEVVMSASARDTTIRNAQIANDVIYNMFKTGVKLETSTKSELVRLVFQYTNPRIAYHIATIATEAFKFRCRQIEMEETRNVVDFVENQKDISKQKLEDTERDLQQFKRDNNFVIGDEEGGLLKKLVELQNQLTDVQTARELSEANLVAFDKRLQELKAPDQPGLNTISKPQTQNLRSELDRLLQQKGDILASDNSQSSDELDKRIEAKKAELFQAILSDSQPQAGSSLMDQSLLDEIRQSRIKEELNLYMLKNRERTYQQLVDRYRAQNPQILERAIEMARLQRSKGVYENLYNILLEKGEEARIKSATGTGGVRIIDEPVMPTRPIPSKLPRNLAIGLLLGLGLGFGLALAIEYMDHSIRSNEDVEKWLKLSVLGTIPVIHKTDAANRQRKAHQNKHATQSDDDLSVYQLNLISSLRPRDPVVDTYRTLRTNLQFAVVDRPMRSMLITSSIPGEGKTLTSANLGITFAELGKRVVLIDGDLRRPMLHNAFGVKRSPGISDCLIKQLPVDSVLNSTSTPNLYVIPCGTIPPNPAEMIASKRMAEFISQLQSSFDLVLIDSPPVTLVTDAVLFSSHVDYVVIVTKFSSTNYRIAKDAVDGLLHAKSNILGVILNGIKTGRGYGYYYKYNYYYYSESERKKA